MKTIRRIIAVFAASAIAVTQLLSAAGAQVTDSRLRSVVETDTRYAVREAEEKDAARPSELTDEELEESIILKKEEATADQKTAAVGIALTEEESEYAQRALSEAREAADSNSTMIAQYRGIKSVYGTDYFYDQMSSAGQALYNSMYTVCQSLSTDFVTQLPATCVIDAASCSIPTSEVNDIFTAFYYSNPQFFFLDNAYSYTYYGNTVTSVSPMVNPNFLMGQDRRTYSNEINRVTASWMTAITANSSVLKRQEIIYKNLSDLITYTSTSRDQSIAGALVDHACVCNGYALAAEYFCNAAGIECITVISVDHAWNLIKLYNNWYEFDVTWIDTDYPGQYDLKWLNKSYSTFTANDASGSHNYQLSQYTRYQLPLCTSDTVEGADDVSDNDDTSVTGTLSSISFARYPTKRSYIQGDAFDLTGGSLKLNYSGTSKYLNLNEVTAQPYSEDNVGKDILMYSGYDPAGKGGQTVTLYYGGKTVTFTITVRELSATAIAIKAQPKTSFVINEEFSTGSGTLNVTYNNGTTAEIPLNAEGVTVDSSRFKSSAVGTYLIRVTYSGRATTYNVTVSIDPANAAVVLENGSEHFYFDSVKNALATITANKNAEADYTLTVNSTVVEKTLTLPAALYAKSLTIITTGSAEIRTPLTALAARGDLTLDASFVHINTKEEPDSKEIRFTAAANSTLTIKRAFADLGTISGTVTSTLAIGTNVTIPTVTTFAAVNIADGCTLTLTGRMAGVKEISGRVMITGAALSSAVVTNVKKAEFVLVQSTDARDNKVIPKLYVTDVTDSLTVSVTDANGNIIALDAGTSILTAGSANTDFTGKIVIPNKTPDNFPLSAFVYTRDIRAEYPGAMTVNGTDYPNFEQAFAHLNATGDNTIVLHLDIAPPRFILPTKIEKLRITSDGSAKTIKLSKIASLSPLFSLTLDNVNIVSDGVKVLTITGRKDISLNNCSITPIPSLRAGTGYSLTLSGNVSELGALTGTNTTDLIVDTDVTAASLTSFGNVRVADGRTLTVPGRVTSVAQLNGTLKVTEPAKTNLVTITNVGSGKLILTSDNGTFSRVTITNVLTSLTFELVDTSGNVITVPSGTPILTAGGTADFTGSIAITNTDSASHKLDAFLYRREVRAEYADILTLNGNGISRNYPNFETAINAINDKEKSTKANAAYTISINGDTSAARLILPTTAGSLTIQGAGGIKTLTLTTTSALSAKYDLTIKDVKIVNLNARNAETPLSISQTAGTLTISDLVCGTLSAVIGSARSTLNLGSCSSIDTISAFGTVNINENFTIGKAFSVIDLNLAANKGITLPSGKTFTAKTINGASGSFIRLENGFRPFVISGTASGTIKLISPAPLAETVHILTSAAAALNSFDVSGIAPNDGLDYALTRAGTKVVCRAAKLGFNGRKYVSFADIVSVIEAANDKNADYTVTLYADYDNGTAVRFPKAGTYNSLTITSSQKKLTFLGSLTLTGNVTFDNTVISAVNAKGDAAKYSITGTKDCTVRVVNSDLGSVISIGSTYSNVTLTNVKAASGQSVRIIAQAFRFSGFSGIIDTIVADTIQADGDQTLMLLEKKVNQIKSGMTPASGTITFRIVTASGSDAALRNGTTIFSAFKGDSFNAALANAGASLTRDSRTFRVYVTM